MSETDSAKEVSQTLRQTLAEKFPQIASKTAQGLAHGLVPLSIALSLAPLVQAPEAVFAYLTTLAPNFISSMLLDMRRENKSPDVDEIAEAVAKRLDDPELQHFADELNIIGATAEVLQKQSEQLNQFIETFGRELDKLKETGWTVPKVIEVKVEQMIAEGKFIAQAKDHSQAVVAYNSTVTIYAKEKRFLRILIGAPTDDLREERQAVFDKVGQVVLDDSYQDLELSASQTVSKREAYHAVDHSDLYIGLLGWQTMDRLPMMAFEIDTALELGKPMLLYHAEGIGGAQQALIDRLQKSEKSYIYQFGGFDSAETWGEQVKSDVEALLQSRLKANIPAPTPRTLPTSGRRGLIASLGRSPGTITGLHDAITRSGVHIDYVRTISTSESQVRRAARTVGEDLALQQMTDYENISIKANEIEDDKDVIEFKQAFVELLDAARVNGDALAIGVTGGRTVMGALLAQVAQFEAPADSAFYQFSVPSAIEDDGRYPVFHNQSPQRQEQILRPMQFFPNQCHLVKIPFSRFYDEL